MSLSGRGDLSGVELLSLLQEVFYAVNPAAELNRDQTSRAQYSALYNEGPLLFEVAAIDR